MSHRPHQTPRDRIESARASGWTAARIAEKYGYRLSEVLRVFAVMDELADTEEVAK